jgi:arginine repressor
MEKKGNEDSKNPLDNEEEDSAKNEEKEQESGIQVLRNLLEDGKTWDTQDEILSELNSLLEKKGMEVIKQPTLSKWLKKCGAVKDGRKWCLSGEEYKHTNNYRILQKLFDKSTGFFRRVRVFALQTKPYGNKEIAEQIKVVFDSEVLSTFCPDDSNIIIFAKKKKDDGGKGDGKSILEEGLLELRRRQKTTAEKRKTSSR